MVYSTTLHAVQNTIRNITGAPFRLSGGCCADTLYHSPQPTKDYDAFIPCGGLDEVTVRLLMEAIEIRLNDLGWRPTFIPCYPGSGGDFNTRLFGLIQFNLDGTSVDLLFSRCKTIQEVAANHDCNMNRLYLDDDGFIVGQKVDFLCFREDGTISEDRKNRMRIKAKLFGICPF